VGAPLSVVSMALSLALFAAPALADAPPLTQDGYLILKAGQAALIHFDADGKLVFDQGWAAPTDPDRPVEPTADHLLLSFTTAGPGSNLVVKSGYATAFSYHARLRRGAAAKPTSVCPIVARGEALESWQDAIDGVEVGDFKAAASSELRCQ
jgi:hypothetical protein